MPRSVIRASHRLQISRIPRLIAPVRRTDSITSALPKHVHGQIQLHVRRRVIRASHRLQISRIPRLIAPVRRTDSITFALPKHVHGQVQLHVRRTGTQSRLCHVSPGRCVARGPICCLAIRASHRLQISRISRLVAPVRRTDSITLPLPDMSTTYYRYTCDAPAPSPVYAT